MKYSVEMGSGVMIILYIPSFTKISSGIQKLIAGIHRHADRISILLFLKRRRVG
jgi:hypothetical protein